MRTPNSDGSFTIWGNRQLYIVKERGTGPDALRQYLCTGCSEYFYIPARQLIKDWLRCPQCGEIASRWWHGQSLAKGANGTT